MYSVEIEIKRLAHCFALPAYAYAGDAGMDLYAANSEPLLVVGGAFKQVPTGIAIALPVGYMALVLPRSGLAARSGMSVLNTPGLIDGNYRGEVQVLLINHGLDVYRVQRGDRIAQLLVLPVPNIVVTEVDALEPTDRQSGGFGSSGR